MNEFDFVLWPTSYVSGKRYHRCDWVFPIDSSGMTFDFEPVRRKTRKQTVKLLSRFFRQRKRQTDRTITGLNALRGTPTDLLASGQHSTEPVKNMLSEKPLRLYYGARIVRWISISFGHYPPLAIASVHCGNTDSINTCGIRRSQPMLISELSPKANGFSCGVVWALIDALQSD